MINQEDITHKVSFVYEDGEASAVFTVRSKVPPTGDTGHPALWLFLVLFGIGGLILALKLRRAGHHQTRLSRGQN